MLRLLSDEDVHEDIIRGLRRRAPALDIVRAVDIGLGQTDDPIILEWAASQERILLTGDLNTMVGFAWTRVKSGEPMPGVLGSRMPAPSEKTAEEEGLPAAPRSPTHCRVAHFCP
jgi:hypothetical protein